MKTNLTQLALSGLLGLGLSACDSSTATASTTTQDAVAAFKADCEKTGGTIHETVCQGHATCAGTYLDKVSGKITETTCKGTNTCEGVQCLQGMQASSGTLSSSATSLSSTTMSSSDAQTSSSSTMDTNSNLKAQLLAAPSADAFLALCGEAKGMVTEQHCNGHNDCAGIYFHTGSYGTKIGAKEISCQGHNTCAGHKCVL